MLNDDEEEEFDHEAFEYENADNLDDKDDNDNYDFVSDIASQVFDPDWFPL